MLGSMKNTQNDLNPLAFNLDMPIVPTTKLIANPEISLPQFPLPQNPKPQPPTPTPPVSTPTIPIPPPKPTVPTLPLPFPFPFPFPWPNPTFPSPFTTQLSTRNNQLWSQNSGGIADVSEAYDRFGGSVISGDFDGDGYDDLAVGISGEDVRDQANAGAIHTLSGSSNGLTALNNKMWTQDNLSAFSFPVPPVSRTVSLNSKSVPSLTLAPSISPSILPFGPFSETGDAFGSSLASGDFNGDGKDDLAVGAYLEDVGTIRDAGVVNILYGSNTGLTKKGNQEWSQNSANILDEAESDAGEGEFRTGDEFGYSVATGDFNNDGYDDLIVGVPREDIGTIEDGGAVNIIYGSANGLNATNNQFLSQHSPSVLGSSDAYDRFGASVTTGDFNGDGYADAAIGVPDEDIGDITNSGAVNILYGSASGLSATNDQLWSQNSDGMVDQSEAFDQFGASLASGDFDQDGYTDLVIGLPGEDIGTIKNAGAISVLYGSADGLSEASNQFWHQNSVGVEGTAEANDRFGKSLTVGDFNNDGYEDVAIGVSGESIGSVTAAGAANILYGSASGLRVTGNQLWHQNSDEIVGGAEAYDRFGTSLAAGDFDGDGLSDLSVGVAGEDIGNIKDAGGINVLYSSKKQSFDLDFRTDNQSIWSSGNAFSIDHDRFLGAEWDKSGEKSFAGFGVKGATSGKIGLDSDLDVQGGSVDATLPIDLELYLPDQIRPGETVTIGTGFSLDNGATFSTTGPSASYKLDFLFELAASAGVKTPVGDPNLFDFDINRSRNLLDIDSNGARFSLSEKQLNGFGSFDIHVPKVNTTSNTKTSDSLSSQGKDDFLSASLDLDRVGTALFQAVGIPIPNLEGSVDVGIVEADYNLLDVDLTADVNVNQEFDLKVDDLTGQLVLENGDRINFTVGEDITFVVPEGIGDELDIDAVLNVDANFRNKTSVGYDVDVELEALSVEGSVDLLLTEKDFSFGPLYEKTFDVASGNVGLYNKTFDLGGFNTETLSLSIDVV